MAKMIKPMIFLKPNQCPHCMGELQVVEEETYVGAIDSIICGSQIKMYEM